MNRRAKQYNLRVGSSTPPSTVKPPKNELHNAPIPQEKRPLSKEARASISVLTQTYFDEENSTKPVEIETRQLFVQ